MRGDGQFDKVPMVRFERRLPGPVERAWDFIADAARLPDWFGEGAIEPRAGGGVSIMGGLVRGIVTQWRPPRRLAYTWNVFNPGEDESPYPESYLTVELAPEVDEVHLTLAHLAVLERFEKQNAMGWHTFLDMLETAIRGQPIEPCEVHMKRNAARYGVDLAKLVK